jgi:hypothetical protein
MSFAGAAGFASVIAAVATAIIAIVSVLLSMIYLRDKSKSRYDELHRRAEISEMRKSYEDQINALTHQLTATDERWKDLNHLLISAQRSQPDTHYSEEIKGGEFLAALGIQAGEGTSRL